MTTPKQARRGAGNDAPRTYAWPPLPPHDFEVISVTSALKSFPKPWLVPWAAKVTAEAAVDDHAIIGALLAKDKTTEAVAHIKGARFANSGAKADRGTVVHGAIESYLAGRAIDTEAITAALEEKRVPKALHRSTFKMIAGLMDFLDDEEPEVVWSESTVYSRTHGYAGTADILGRMRVGGSLVPVVIDIKTSKSIYDEVALQLAAYAMADFVGQDDGTEAPLMPDGEPIRHGVVVRPTALGKYEKAVFTLTDELLDVFLACLSLATSMEVVRSARRPK